MVMYKSKKGRTFVSFAPGIVTSALKSGGRNDGGPVERDSTVFYDPDGGISVSANGLELCRMVNISIIPTDVIT